MCINWCLLESDVEECKHQSACRRLEDSSQGPGAHSKGPCWSISRICIRKAQGPPVEARLSGGVGAEGEVSMLENWDSSTESQEMRSKTSTGVEALLKEDSSWSAFEENLLKRSFFRKISSIQLSPPVLIYAILAKILWWVFHIQNHEDSVQLEIPTQLTIN